MIYQYMEGGQLNNYNRSQKVHNLKSHCYGNRLKTLHIFLKEKQALLSSKKFFFKSRGNENSSKTDEKLILGYKLAPTRSETIPPSFSNEPQLIV